MDPYKDEPYGKTTFSRKTVRVGKQAKCQFIGIFFLPPSSNCSKIMSTIYAIKYKSGEFLCFIT